ncbi:hypothetical protein IWX49DRAFT_325277 [Phyllosticta citricarpa]
MFLSTARASLPSAFSSISAQDSTFDTGTSSLSVRMNTFYLYLIVGSATLGRLPLVILLFNTGTSLTQAFIGDLLSIMSLDEPLFAISYLSVDLSVDASTMPHTDELLTNLCKAVAKLLLLATARRKTSSPWRERVVVTSPSSCRPPRRNHCRLTPGQRTSRSRCCWSRPGSPSWTSPSTWGRPSPGSVAAALSGLLQNLPLVAFKRFSMLMALFMVSMAHSFAVATRSTPITFISQRTNSCFVLLFSLSFLRASWMASKIFTAASAAACDYVLGNHFTRPFAVVFDIFTPICTRTPTRADPRSSVRPDDASRSTVGLQRNPGHGRGLLRKLQHARLTITGLTGLRTRRLPPKVGWIPQASRTEILSKVYATLPATSHCPDSSQHDTFANSSHRFSKAEGQLNRLFHGLRQLQQHLFPRNFRTIVDSTQNPLGFSTEQLEAFRPDPSRSSTASELLRNSPSVPLLTPSFVTKLSPSWRLLRALAGSSVRFNDDQKRVPELLHTKRHEVVEKHDRICKQDDPAPELKNQPTSGPLGSISTLAGNDSGCRGRAWGSSHSGVDIQDFSRAMDLVG